MLPTRRLITALTFNDGVLFRTKLFRPDYRYTQKLVGMGDVDEIVALDVTRGDRSGVSDIFLDTISRLSSEMFVPLAAGGGVRSWDDAQKLLRAGADKIVLNTAVLETPELVSQWAQKLGGQSMMFSLDVQREPMGTFSVWFDCGRKIGGTSPTYWLNEARSLGCFEILVNSIDRDGSLQGYDLELGKSLVPPSPLPTILLGGCGSWQHMVEAFREIPELSGAATSNIFHFTDPALRAAKVALRKGEIDVRPSVPL